jgi:hypothetical protein
MNAAQRRQFLFAGNAIFTITSQRTGTSFTYKFSVPRDERSGEEGPMFAAVLTGPDNTRDYTYMGIVDRARNVIRCTKGSKIFGDAPSYKALTWFLQNLDSDRVEFRHCGRCGRCGRTLTVPSSIDSGLGPECAGKVGVL